MPKKEVDEQGNAGESLPVAALCGSAGSIQSLKNFFNNLPADTGLAYVVVVHLDPTQKSNLSEILSKHTSMSVTQVEDQDTLQPNRVYVAGPGKIVRIEKDRIVASSFSKKGRPATIDEFLISLASARKQRALAVIFSGFGSDGSYGVKQVRANNGLCFAENIELAEYAAMPDSAIATGSIDFTASAQDLAKKVAEVASVLVGKIGKISIPHQDTLQRIFSLLAKKCRINFAPYKQTTIQRRLERRIMLNRLASPEAYLAYLSNNPEELEALCDDLLIKVTEFFRDSSSFEVVANVVFPQILEKATKKSLIRVWVAGCSTGEEAYSLAIMWLEFLENKNLDVGIQIFATDISQKAIDSARLGVFDKSIKNSISPDRLQKYFVETVAGYQIKKQVRDLCIFAVHNLVQDPQFSQLDLITCRNVLIYFSQALQKRLIPSFHFSLKSGGFLWVGGSESIGDFNELFDLTDKSARVYQKKDAFRRLQYHPSFDLSVSSIPSALPASSAHEEVIDEEKIKRQAEKLILTKIGPAGWIVNKDDQIVHIFGKTAPYIAPQTGSPSHHLYKLIRNELHYPLRTAIKEVKEGKIPVTKNDVKIRFEGGLRSVGLQVHPLRLMSQDYRYFLIVIKEQGELPIGKEAADQSIIDGDKEPSAEETRRLQQELEDVRSQMQSALDNQEASNEELRTTNEELLSSNEELRSTNEELQTAKEELQSSNEELGTLNDELQIRNEDLGQLSDDLDNFIKSTQFPVIMVDTQFRIRRFTLSAKSLFNVISSDTTRPLSDLKPNFELPEFDKLLSDVVESLQVVERDIKTKSGKWYLMHIRPYKNSNNQIAGAILTFSDITERKQMEEFTKKSEEMFRAVVSTVREPLLILDKEFIVKEANESFFKMFNVAAEETINRKLWSLGDSQWNIPRLRSLLEQVLPKQKVFTDFVVEHEFKTVGKKIMRLNGRPIESENLILLAIEDLTGATGRKND